MNNLSKLLVGSVAAVTLLSSALVANAQVGDPELDMAVSWMSTNGMTKATNASNFNPAGTLTRDQGSKFFSEYAVSNLCLTPDASRSCSFSDLGQADPTLSSFVTKSCQLGIFNGSNGVFMPQAPLTKAQFITALIRAVDDMKNENVTPRWKNYHAKALQLNITKETDAWALDRPVTRYEAALMLYRSRVDACPSAGTTTTTTTTTTDNGGDLASILGELFGEEEETTSTTTTTTNSSANTGGEEVVVTTTTTAQPTCPAVVCGANDCGTVSNTCGNSANCGACPTTTVVTTTPTTTVTPTTVTPTTTTTTNTSGRGTATCNANVSLNPASPAGNGQEVPGLATAVVGMYDITAT